MKSWYLSVLVLLAGPAAADPFFTGNPWSPIPPGCVTRPDLQQALYGEHEIVVFDGETRMIPASSLYAGNSGSRAGERLAGNLRITRHLCAEPNRSALIVQFGIPESVELANRAHYLRPLFWADTTDGASVGWFSPLIEPAAAIVGRIPDRLGQAVFGDFADGWEYLGYVKWNYLLDLAGPLPGYKAYADLAADAYNEELDLMSELHMWDEPPVPWRVPATATADALPASMPLNGRHSGSWIIEGARDQGITLSFSNRVPLRAAEGRRPEWAPLLLFLSWYTFDTKGRTLWLTGAAEFRQGADRVELTLTRVRGGAFLGTRQAQRSEAGSVTLSARSCADLVLDFDLSPLGMGAGSKRLERLHDLEVAGYNCRDHDARRVSAFGGSH